MISNEQLENQLKAIDDVVYVCVEGDGYHYQLTIVSNLFDGKSKVARQQWVYGQLQEHITNGSLHALTMKTLTKAEWEQLNG